MGWLVTFSFHKGGRNALTGENQYDKIRVKDGWIVCPGCGRHLMRITPETEAKKLPVFCRGCRQEIILDIERGLSARRLSP